VSDAPTPSPASRAGVRKLKIICAVLLLCVVALDLWSKGWMQDHLGMVPGQRKSARVVEVISGFLAWEGTWNPGVTFGLAPYQTNLILGLTGIATLLLLIWFLGTRSRGKALHVGLALILAGAVGNFYDRWTFGEVRDFVLVYTGTLEERSFEWPNFNVADSGIVCGVVLVMWDALFGYSAKQAKSQTTRKKEGAAST
jgi:signal peptidase II